MKKVPKYKNTPDFPKLNTLYNYDRQHALPEGYVIVVESPMTVLYLMSHGYPNSVATFGASGGLSQAQALLLGSLGLNVCLWVDNDPAGKLYFEQVDKRGKVHRAPGLVMLEDYVSTYIIPVVPGNHGDPGDVQPDEIGTYLARAYPSELYDIEGLAEGI